ncbi:hypothetical protein N9D90_01030 [Alphaproteobacteria bacterium]|nr:hypothetical protein [Alphaproteobacteria bacterium]
MLNFAFLQIFAKRVSCDKIIILSSSNYFVNQRIRRFRCGLHNFRGFSDPHLLQTCKRLDCFICFIFAAITYSRFLLTCRQYCEKQNIKYGSFVSLASINFMSYLDVTLHWASYKNIRAEVHTHEHFSVYTQLLSAASKVNKNLEFVCHQHGVFEHPPVGRSYQKIKPKKIVLKYRDSKRWVQQNFVDPESKIICPSLKIRHTANYESDIPIVAVATAEGLEADQRLLEAVHNAWISAAKSFKVLIYPHPLVGISENIKKKYHSFAIFNIERHKNITLLVTRYSSLGVEYGEQGVNVLFWSGGEKICVMETENKFIEIVEDFDIVASKIISKMQVS